MTSDIPDSQNNLIFSAGEISLRRMQPTVEDYRCMVSWLSNPAVLEFYEGRDHPFTMADVEETFSPFATEAKGETACILEWRGEPIGYMQFYPLDPEDKAEFGYPVSTRIFGIDQFVGKPEYWGKGIGCKAVKHLVDFLFTSMDAEKVVLDPHADNVRALRCYEKAGFKKVKLLPAHELHEGIWHDCWLMEISKQACSGKDG